METIMKEENLNDWKEVKLQDVCEFERGVEPGSKFVYSEKKGKPFIKVSTMSGKRKELFFTDIETNKVAKKGDILLSLDGSLGLVRNDLEGVYSTGIRKVYFKDNNKYSNFYLYYLLQSNNIQKTIVKHCNDGGIIKHSSNSTKFMKVPLPPLQEQERIAEILSNVDDQIEKTQEIITKSEEIKQGLMQELLIKGIGHKEFKEVMITHNKYKIPSHWKLINLYEISNDKDAIVAGPFGSNLKVSDYKDKGIPIIRLQNVQRNFFLDKDMKYISKEKAQELKYHSFKAGDIVLAKLGIPVGKTCKIPPNFEFGIVVADVVRIRPNNSIANFDFIEYILNFKLCEQQLTNGIIGSTRPRVNLSDVRNLKIPLPPLVEQEQIANILSNVDNDITKEKNYLNELQEIKKGLMQDLLSGKVRVN